MDAKLAETLERCEAVPPVPQVVVRFLQLMQDPEFSYAQLSRVLSADPGTVGEVLRMTNSAFFGLSRKVSSLPQALTLLGPRRLRSLVIGRCLAQTVSKREVPGLDMSYFWRRSLTCGVVASRFAETALPDSRDEAFIAALLARVGMVVLGQAFSQNYQCIVERFRPGGKQIDPEDERRAVGTTSGEVSAWVLRRWGVADCVCEAIEYAALGAAASSGPAGRLQQIVTAADIIGSVLSNSSQTPDAARACLEAAEAAGVDAPGLGGMLEQTRRDFDEVAGILGLDVIPGQVYESISRTIQEQLVSAL